MLHFAAIEAQPDRNMCTDIIIIHLTPEAARRHRRKTNCAHTQRHTRAIERTGQTGAFIFRPFLCSNPNCCLSTRCKYKKKRSWRMWTTAIVFACRQIVLISVEKLLCWEKARQIGLWIGARGFLDLLFFCIVFAQHIHK